jgi:hypothetical protein
MTAVNETVSRYFAAWNETDGERRRRLIAETWAETANYLDPVMRGAGHAEIDAMIRGVQERFPGHRFRQTGAVDAYQDRARFSWELAPEAGEAIVKGTDFAVLAADSRLQAVTGFFDLLPG